MADLVVHDAELLATMDDDRRELAGGWVAITDGLVEAVGGPLDPRPAADATLDARRLPCYPRSHQHPSPHLPEPHAGLPAGHQGHAVPVAHHAVPALEPARRGGGVRLGVDRPGRAGPRWLHHHDRPPLRPPAGRRRPDQRRDHGCAGAGRALPPDAGFDEPLAEGRRPAPRLASCRTTTRSWPTPSASSRLHHDPSPGAMVRVALAPCSPFSVTPELMRRTAELAERLDVRLHTHLAEDPDEDAFADARFGKRTIEHFEDVGWCTDRTWVAHCIYPNDAEIARLGRRGRRRGPLPQLEHDDRRRGHRPGARAPGRRRAGGPRLRRLLVHRLGLAVDGSPQRHAPRAAAGRAGVDRRPRRPRAWPPGAAPAASVATASSASSRPARLATSWCWPLDGVRFAGAISDPIEAWLRCGPVSARHTVVAGRVVVRDGRLESNDVDEMLRRHRRLAERFQRSDAG